MKTKEKEVAHLPNNIYLKYPPRPQQKEILETLKNGVKNDKKFFLIEAPTGSGKSFVPILFFEWFYKNVEEDVKIDVITHTKSLQDQYLKDFEFIGNVKGKVNYECKQFKTTCDEGAIIGKSKKIKCPFCPYKTARDGFLNRHIGLTNFHMLNSFWMYASRLLESKARTKNVLFIDEAHLYEENFCSFIETRISTRVLGKLGITDAEAVNEINSAKTIQDIIPVLKSIIVEARSNLAEIKREISSLGDSADSTLIKRGMYIDEWICKSYRFLNDIKETGHTNNWVFESNFLPGSKDKTAIIQPVWGKDYIKEYIWEKYDYVILMSGTILDASTFSNMLNLAQNKTTYLKLENTFPAKRRPIFYINSGSLGAKTYDSTIKNVISSVESILNKHKQHKGIIHTGNYKISNAIRENIHSDRLIFHTSEDREEALEKHLKSERKTVLVSPSMFTGVDLKDDLARFQIIVKIPYPYLGSKYVQKRKEMLPSWYQWKTLNDLIQSYGRPIRHDKDWAYTYILDGSFSNLFRYSKGKIPGYVHDGLEAGNTILSGK